MVFGVFVVMPQRARADGASIDIGDLGLLDKKSKYGEDAWRYVSANNELSLTENYGNYMLTGTNLSLRITIPEYAQNVNVVFNGVTISNPSGCLVAHSSCKLSLFGTNIAKCYNSISHVLFAYGGLTIDGTGSLRAESASDSGIMLDAKNVTNKIVGTASVTVVSKYTPVFCNGNFLLGENASLTMTMTGGKKAENLTIGRAESGPSTQWSLTGSLTTTDLLTAPTINVTVPIGGSGTVRRDTPGPTTINIANLTSSNAINQPGQYVWAYTASSKQLSLYAPNSSYTLQGTNPNLSISVANTANNANITLNGVNCTAQSTDNTFNIRSNCTVTLQGTNTLTQSAANYTCAFGVYSGCTINGNGSLTASGDNGIYVYNSGILRVTGTAALTAIGRRYPVDKYDSNSFLLGDNASLTMTNNSSGAKTCTIGRADSGGSTQWRLTGAAATDAPLSASSINVSIPAGGTGAVLRSAPTTINIDELTYTKSNPAGQDAWSYNHTNKTLTLSAENGIYTLANSNNDLNINVGTTAANAKVTLNNVNSTAVTGVAFSAYNNFTLTLTGTNTLTSNGGPAFSLIGSARCTINGGGSLTTTSSAASGPGIHLDSGAALRLTGTTSVTAAGTSGPIDTTGSIMLGDTAALTLTNKSGGARTRAVSRDDTGSTSQWRLNGSATTTEALTASAINVTVPAGGTGTVLRSRPSEINISTLGTSNTGNAAGYDAWNYDASAKELQLTIANGDYTLTGTNTNLRIYVAGSALNAKITLNNVTCNATGYDQAFWDNGASTVTLIGSNRLTSNSGNAFYVSGNECIITGSGSLAVSGGRGIVIYTSSTLRITGSAAVTAIGKNGAVADGGSLLMGDNTTLTMTNNSNTAGARAIGRADTGGGTLWMLSGSAFTTDALSAASINVTIPSLGTGTVRRDAPVCSIGSTQYPTLDAAITAAPAGGSSPTVIKLLRNISHPDQLLISNKKITFDLSGYNLVLEKQLSVNSGSVIDYTGTGAFKIAINWSGDVVGATYHGLFISNTSYVRLTGIEINDIGTGEYREVTAISAYHNSIVEIEGDVKAISNGAAGSSGVGIYTSAAGTVNVSGNVTADTRGVWTSGSGVGEGAKVTVDGTIQAPAYIVINLAGTVLTIDDKSSANPKSGYLTYTNGYNTVWVKTLYICRIESTGTKYSTLDAAIAAVPEGGAGQTVISLLTHITHPDPITISNKKISFDLCGFNLIIGNLLTVRNNSLVDYRSEPGGEFKVVCNISSTGSYSSFTALNVSMNSTVQLSGVGITDTGSGTDSNTTAVRCDYGSTVLVEGDVKATGNNATGSYGVGVSAYDSGSSVTVEGNIITSDKGVTTGWGAQVTVDGTITAPAYIVIEGMTKTITDSEIYTTKLGYFTYANGTSTVWVLNPNPIKAISWNDVTANGVSGSETTTQLTLTFSDDPVTLTAADITLFGASKGSLSGTGTTRALDIVDITEVNLGYVTVIIDDPAGYAITPPRKLVLVYSEHASAAIIDIGALDSLDDHNEPGFFTWFYDAGYRELYLQAPGGEYIITGTNPDLSIKTVINASITLVDMNCTSNSLSYIPLNVGSSCTVTLVGSNTLTSGGNAALFILEEQTCTINGSGSLTAVSTGSVAIGFDDLTSTLIIKDTASVTAIGEDGAINAGNWGYVLLGDNATLTMTNNGNADSTRPIGRADTGGSGQWKLTGAATTGDPLTGATINVTIPAMRSGTVSRTQAAYKQGDINEDGDVNVLDLSILLANFGKSGAAISDLRADINNDGDVNVLDLSILLANFGK